MHRREFISVAATVPLALSRALHSRVLADQKATKTPIIILFCSGGVSHKESFNPDPPSTTAELRGPLGSIPTKTPGVHFSEVFPELAKRQDKFALIRNLDSGSSDHTPSQKTAILSGERTVTEVIGDSAANGGIPYILLNPGSNWPGLQDAFRMGQSFCPIWNQEKKCLTPPEMSPVNNLAERKELLDALDRSDVPSPMQEKIRKFRATAFDLLSGGGGFMEALRLPEIERKRFGGTLVGDLVLTAKRFVERGAGAVTVYDEPESVAYDLHNNIGDGMKHMAPPMDKAASVLLDEITSGRLHATLLLMGEFSRTPKINPTAGRDHWQYGNCAILAGSKIKGGVVIGKTDKFGRSTEDIKQGETLPNTMLAACGQEVRPDKPRVRDVLV